jgi:hypothetical protein
LYFREINFNAEQEEEAERSDLACEPEREGAKAGLKGGWGPLERILRNDALPNEARKKDDGKLEEKEIQGSPRGRLSPNCST